MPRRVQLLVSVRNAAKALAAFDGGAGIIDVKEPSRGPLGMADPGVMRAVVDAVAGRAPVSVAMGELRDDPPMHLIPSGVTFAKIGLAGATRGWERKLAATFAEAPRVKPIAVAYFNPSPAAPPPKVEHVIEWAAAQQVYGVLFDTGDKSRGNLFESNDPRAFLDDDAASRQAQVEACVRRVQRSGLRMALAGSLRGEAFELALSMSPDIVGIRGAACAGNNRDALIDAGRVRALANLIAAHNAQPAATAG